MTLRVGSVVGELALSSLTAGPATLILRSWMSAVEQQRNRRAPSEGTEAGRRREAYAAELRLERERWERLTVAEQEAESASCVSGVWPAIGVSAAPDR